MPIEVPTPMLKPLAQPTLNSLHVAKEQLNSTQVPYPAPPPLSSFHQLSLCLACAPTVKRSRSHSFSPIPTLPSCLAIWAARDHGGRRGIDSLEFPFYLALSLPGGRESMANGETASVTLAMRLVIGPCHRLQDRASSGLSSTSTGSGDTLSPK